MRKMFGIILILIIFESAILSEKKLQVVAFSNAETTTYAKALVGCTLYKSQNLVADIDNVYFQIPETYFMIVLENITDNCVRVQYDKYVGYVNSNSIIIATFIPIVKTLDDITFDIKTTSGTQIWDKPSTSGHILTTVIAGTKNLNYIATCYGSIPSGGESNVWIYASFTPETNLTNVYEGYIYSENITNLKDIVANTESNPEIILSDDKEELNDIYISPTIKTVLIVIVVSPIILLFLVVLYKIVKKIKKYTEKRNFQNKYLNDNQNDFGEENLKLTNEINNFKNETFVRKQNLHHVSDRRYPKFPNYDADDDLL